MPQYNPNRPAHSDEALYGEFMRGVLAGEISARRLNAVHNGNARVILNFIEHPGGPPGGNGPPGNGNGPPGNGNGPPGNGNGPP